MPVLLAGLKVGATLAVIGTLVGEFVQPRSEGLGYLLVTARYQFKTDLVFVVLITLSAIALTLYGLVCLTGTTPAALAGAAGKQRHRPRKRTASPLPKSAHENIRYVEEEI